MVLPIPLDRRVTNHNSNAGRLWKNIQYVVDCTSKIERDRNHGVILRKRLDRNSPLLHARVHGRDRWKKRLPMSLQEVCRRRTDRNDQIELSLGKECMQIIDERALFILRRTRGCERRLENVDGLLRLPSELLADGSCVFVPRRKVAAEGMQDQDPLRLSERVAGHGEKQYERDKKYPGSHVLPQPQRLRAHAGLPRHYNL